MHQVSGGRTHKGSGYHLCGRPPFYRFQCHIDALTNALLAKYVMKRSGILPVGTPGMEKLDGIDFLGAGSLEMPMAPSGVINQNISCIASGRMDS